MLIIERSIARGEGLAQTQLAASAFVELDWQVRQKSRFDAIDSAGRALAVFLPRGTQDRVLLLGYMRTEYVEQLRRRDGRDHGCMTCHGPAMSFRFLPRN